MDPELRRACNFPNNVLEVFIRNWTVDALRSAILCLTDDILFVERELNVRKGMGGGGAMQNIMDERYLMLVRENLKSICKELISRG